MWGWGQCSLDLGSRQKAGCCSPACDLMTRAALACYIIRIVVRGYRSWGSWCGLFPRYPGAVASIRSHLETELSVRLPRLLAAAPLPMLSLSWENGGSTFLKWYYLSLRNMHSPTPQTVPVIFFVDTMKETFYLFNVKKRILLPITVVHTCNPNNQDT